MKLVTRENLEHWSNTVFSKSTLPYLLSRLIRATTPSSTKANLPSGSATYIGGWDGIVSCEEETAYVPLGVSLWECGTSSDCKGKADDDYVKRKNNPGGFIPRDSVFIFVTPRIWVKKDEWIAEKKAENFWKDVKVYDSIELEQWLDNALSVSRWLASQNGISTYPFDGIMTADDFWEEWSVGPNGVLLPEFIIAGREFEKDLLLSTLRGEPTIKGIKASTKSEAIAFIIASAKIFPSEEFDRFFSKALIVDTEANYRGIRINTNNQLNLIPRFEDAQPLYLAVSKGHHVLVPLGADDDFNQEIITLPTIDRDGQIESLIQSGLSRDNAERFSRESGRNITILKKLLGFPHYKAKWMGEENIREIIPALILGRWNENYEGDVELIEKLSEQKYSDYLITLNKWKNLQESPIIQIGETWRLTSPLDLWTNLSSQLTSNDFQNLNQCFSIAFKKGNPIVEPDDKSSFAANFIKKNKFSSWSRAGLTQSLVLVGKLSATKITNLENAQYWVDNIIFDLLNEANGEMWISVDNELPLLSEASPNSFLKAVKKSLEKEEPEIMEMFKEFEGFLHKTSHHTGLLWALENLAWLPEYLRDVSLNLLKLTRLDPGGNLSNRPLNSLSEIFKPWHYQTLATFEERIDILKYVTNKEKESGWNLLLKLLPVHHGIAHPTHKMRWRMFDEKTNIVYTYKEIWDTHSAVLDMLLDLYDNDEKKFSQLLDAIPTLTQKDRKKLLDWADSIHSKIKQDEFVAWDGIRRTLNHHRSYPHTDWALPESELLQLEKLYNKLKPKDIVSNLIWLFNEHWPKFSDPIENVDNQFESAHQLQQSRIDNERINAVNLFINEIGLNATLELRKQVKEYWSFGDTLAKVVNNKSDIYFVCECLNDKQNLIGFVQSFIYRKSIIENFEWVKLLFTELQEKNFNNLALSNILIPLNQNQQLWNFVALQNPEIQKEYWLKMIPHFYNISDQEKSYGLEMLLKYKRFFSAIDIASHFTKEIQTILLAEILRKAGTEEASDTSHFRGYEVEKIFDELENRIDIEKSTLIQLEWLYLPILDSYGTKRSPKNLEQELAKSPEFFIEVLKWIYVPTDKTLLDKEREDIPEELIQNRANHAYHLIHSWKRIPGMTPDNSINEHELLEWVKKVRALAEDVSRLDVADAEIGKILAQFPENSTQWPEENIFKVIEEINTDSLKANYSAELYNKRSFSSRGAFDGGDIEREKATYFSNLANKFKNKYPNVADIFKNMERRYLLDSKRMDEEAERKKLEY